jgi:hypothetical protein
LCNRVKVMMPIGELSPAGVAESVRVTELVSGVTVVGLGVVRVGPAMPAGAVMVATWGVLLPPPRRLSSLAAAPGLKLGKMRSSNASRRPLFPRGCPAKEE